MNKRRNVSIETIKDIFYRYFTIGVSKEEEKVLLDYYEKNIWIRE